MFKSIIKRLFHLFGLDIHRLQDNEFVIGSSHDIPVGSMDVLLEGLKDRGLRCNAIMDVGANRTAWSQKASSLYPHSWFYLIEPLEEFKHLLLEFSIYHEKVKSFDVALGPDNGERTLTVWDDLDGSSFLPAEDEKLKSQGKQRTIEMTTADDLIKSFNLEIPDLVKLDVQGFELEVLKGASSLMGKTQAFILEVSLYPFDDLPGVPLFDEVEDFMKERGYVIYDFGGFYRRPVDGALGQFDVCFVLKDSYLREDSRWSN